MKTLQALLFLMSVVALQPQARAEDAVYLLDSSEPTQVTVDEKRVLVVRKHLVRIPVPKGIGLFHYKTKNSDGYYVILLTLAEEPPEGFRPIIVLGQSTLVDEVEVVEDEYMQYQIKIRTKDKVILEEWNKRLKTLFFPNHPE